MNRRFSAVLSFLDKYDAKSANEMGGHVSPFTMWDNFRSLRVGCFRGLSFDTRVVLLWGSINFSSGMEDEDEDELPGGCWEGVVDRSLFIWASVISVCQEMCV